MKTRIQDLMSHLNQGLYEKETEIRLSLLAALAGQSVLLLGPPGVAKSMVGRRLKHAFVGARAFEYLMSRFSTPDEIFGPVSISQLKSNDRYERCVDGYLPTADVVFLDEIWKAGPAIQNTLLTVVNEKVYLNGQTLLHLPLKLLIGASNELPTEGEELEALWDRFIVRLVCSPIRDESNFYKMIAAPSAPAPDEGQSDSAFTSAEYEEIQGRIDSIGIEPEVLTAITAIRRALKDVKVEGQDVHHNIYVSDRRWNRIVRLLRTSAMLHDRGPVTLADLQIAVHCLWNEPDELPAVSRIVADAIFSDYRSRLDAMTTSVARAMKRRQIKEAREKAHAHGDHRDDDLIVYDGVYYGIDDRESGHMLANGAPTSYIYVTDFQSLPTHLDNGSSVRGVTYQDPTQHKRRIVRAYTNPDVVGTTDVELTPVNLYRDSRSLFINGVRYSLRRGLPGSALEAQSGLEPKSEGRVPELEEYESQVDDLFVGAASLQSSLRSHLFVSADVSDTVSSYMEGFKRQVAVLRADIRKLLYDE